MNYLKLAVRQLLKNPGFTAVAVLTLALGIGACTAMFSVVHAVLLRPLPFQNADRLVWIENSGSGGMSSITTRVDNFLDWCAQNESFEKLGAYFAFFDYSRYTLIGAGEPQRLRGVGVSQNFLDVLGVRPLLGRSFTEEECVWNGRKAAMLSHAFWRERFNGDPGAVGRTITLNGDPTEIVGVLPATFDFDAVFSPGMKVELLVPFPLVEQTARWGNTIFAIGRLKPSVTIAQARSEFDVINKRLHTTHPERGTDFGARMTGLEESIRGQFRPAFLVLSGAVACVLLIACVNLSNLLLARANTRRKEFAVRVALGAGRWPLIRQAMTESLLLAMCGCALGAPLAFVAIPSLSSLQAFSIPLLKTTKVDGTVLIFTLLLSCLAGLVCAVLPAIQLFSQDLREHLNESGRGGSASKQSASIRNALVVSEVAVACMLLVAAGLLIRSFIGLLEVNPGFQPQRTVAWRADLTGAFSSRAERNHYYDELVRRIESVPGIESVGLTDTLPLGRNREWGAAAKGETYPPGQYPDAFPRIVDHRYLQTMRIPLRGGRYFEVRDTAESEHVIVINETMARRLWPGRDAIGQIVQTGGGDWKVIGIVGDVRHGALESAPGAEMYQNFRQTDDWNAIEVVVRSSRPVTSFVPDVREAIKAFDAELPSTEFTTLEQVVDRTVAPRRLITELLGLFSSLGLILASLGLYGVIAYSVSQRTREIGVRMALGAQRRDVLALVLSQGARLTAGGIVIGLAGSFALTRVIRGLLFGVGPFDVVTFVSIPLVFIVVALAACWLPARHAADTNPMEALRNE
jgi:putative ABC transport system permease protein